MDRWTSAVDVGVDFDVIYFDFKGAFDSVVHSKLLFKLEHLGFGGPLLQWLGAFLTDRQQRVGVENLYSSFLPICSGVPQGSVLGPLLFVIYISDLLPHDTTDSDLNLKFADDVKEGTEIINHSDYTRLNNTVAEVSSWSTQWQLPLSKEKCFSFRVGSPSTLPPYQLDGGALECRQEVRDLGVWFTSNLKSTTHCSKITAQAFRRLFIVRRCFARASAKTLIWAFKVFVRPLLEYASPAWSPYLLQDIDLLESVQRNFTRSLPGYRGLPAGERLRRSGLDPLELRRLYADLLLVYKITHQLLPLDFPFFELQSYTATRGHSWKLRHLGARLDCRKNFFAIRVVGPWNSLSENTVSSQSVSAFRRSLREHDLTHFLKRPY